MSAELSSSALAADRDATDGDVMLRLIEELFPICRSITGEGVRQTLRVLRDRIPLEVAHPACRRRRPRPRDVAAPWTTEVTDVTLRPMQKT